jgi:hypothetical protein
MGCTTSRRSLDLGGANEFRERLVWTRRKDFYEEYEVISEIGSGVPVLLLLRLALECLSYAGSMGTVSVVRRRRNTKRGTSVSGTYRQFAMKTIIVNRVTPEMINELLNEIRVLRTLDHPNIIQLHEVRLFREGTIVL